MGSLIRDRYEVLEVVGRGGQGEVLKALDHQHDRIVALKVRRVHTETDRAALLREARILLSIKPHPNLPLVREDFFEGDRYYLALDWIEGKNLQEIIEGEGRPGLPLDRVLRYLDQIADALEHLHTHKPPVVHKDVKPGNIVLVGNDRLVLVDFGIAANSGRTASTEGTAGFTAPEVESGQPAGPPSDVFSFAATTYALLAGVSPDQFLQGRLLRQVRRGRKILRALRPGLSIDPRRRPQTARAFARSIRHAAAGFLRRDTAEAPARLPKPIRRMGTVLIITGLIVPMLMAYGQLSEPETPRALPTTSPTSQARSSSPAKIKASPSVLPLICKQSFNPACGRFRWDPKPEPNQPMKILVSVPATAKIGEMVTAIVTIVDPDAEIADRLISFGDGDAFLVPPLILPPQPYGPWAPPPRLRGYLRVTRTHVYRTAGTFRGQVWADSGIRFDYNPYTNNGGETFTVVVHEDEPTPTPTPSPS